MKRKIINIVELVLHFITLGVLFFSKYESALITGYYNGLPVYSSTEKAEYFWYKELFENPIYCLPLIILWTISIVMCIVSIFSKQKGVDGKMHAALPIINFAITTWVMLSLTISKAFFVITFLMFIIIIIGFVKRSKLIVGEIEKPQQVINNIQETSNADELKKYKDLLDSGVITQEEFEAKKKQLLGL